MQKPVRVNEVSEGQTDPTPMMRKVTVIPHEGGLLFEFDACPDTGCTKTIIARNLAIRQDMRFNPGSTLVIRALTPNDWTTPAWSHLPYDTKDDPPR